MTFDELVNIALVGTGRSTLTIADDNDTALATALARTHRGSGEDRLLCAAAVLSAYELCGTASAASTSIVGDVAPDDERPACSRRAADLLAQVFVLPNTPTKQHLTNEWLQAATRAKRRAPHVLLPALLDYGAANRSIREAIATVIDQRGLWLMSLNKRWQFTSGEDENAATLWTTGNREQRTSALRRLRDKEPAAALALVQSTWKEDGADERTNFVESMLRGLSIADEPFLEAALDDRSKQVRAAAASLLSRLATSALVARMIARVDPLIIFHPKGAGGLLRRAKPASIDVALPPEPFDQDWARDGIIEKPPPRMGQRQWWLQQMLSAIPPSHWSTKWQLTPAECVAAATGDFAEVVRDAWAVAAERHAEADWILALVKASLHGRTGGPRFELVAHLPDDLRRTALFDLLSLPDVNPASLARLLDATSELDEPLTLLAIGHVEKQITKSDASYNYHAAALLAALAMSIPPHLHDRLVAKWVDPAWEANGVALGQFFQTLQLRRDIQAEFAS